ncbi:hypothetical protein B0H11DRAFT_2285918 [Mycena galericulata]|nr:hypothetical protein B0H11DRAFT_2285918 [Mycena galericulata]
MKFNVLSIFSVAVIAAVQAMALTPRDLFDPPITYPKSGTVWFVNQTQNVTWDTSEAPVNITNKVGMIRLRKDNLTTPRKYQFIALENPR